MTEPTTLQVRREGVRLDTATPGTLRIALTVLSEFLAASDRITSMAPTRDARLRPDIIYKVNTGIRPVVPAGVRPVEHLPWRATKEAWAVGTEIKRVEIDAESGELVIYFTVTVAVGQSSVPFWFETLIGDFQVPEATADEKAPTERLIGQQLIVDRHVANIEPGRQGEAPRQEMTASQRAVGMRQWLAGPTNPAG